MWWAAHKYIGLLIYFVDFQWWPGQKSLGHHWQSRQLGNFQGFSTNLYFGFHFNKSIFIVFACFDKICNFIFKPDVFTDQTIFMVVNTAVNCVNFCHQMIQDFVSSLWLGLGWGNLKLRIFKTEKYSKSKRVVYKSSLVHKDCQPI